MEKKEIAVGDSTRIEIIFSTKQYKTRVTKRPRVQTNEGPPDKRIQIIATPVLRPDSTYPLTMRPYKLDLTQFGDKVRKDIEFSINNVSATDLDLSLVSFDRRYFTVELPNSVGANSSATGKLVILESMLDKNFEKSFTIEVNDEKKSRFSIPVKRNLRPAPGVKAQAQKGGTLK